MRRRFSISALILLCVVLIHDTINYAHVCHVNSISETRATGIERWQDASHRGKHSLNICKSISVHWSVFIYECKSFADCACVLIHDGTMFSRGDVLYQLLRKLVSNNCLYHDDDDAKLLFLVVIAFHSEFDEIGRWNKFVMKWGWNHLYSIKHPFTIHDQMMIYQVG